MSVGRYRMMDQMKDEDKWAKYFTKPQITVLIIAFVVAFQIARIAYAIDILFIGLLLGILLLLGTALLVMAPMPKNKYLYGGGEMLYVLAIRVASRKVFKKKKIIYTMAMVDLEEDGLA